ncbi:MAG: hypothetical protein ACI4GY_09430 [Acutalibacteraceae bacterium]
MQSDISHGDFEKMQEQAIKRVNEMKQKANMGRSSQPEQKHNENGVGNKNLRPPIISRMNERPQRPPMPNQKPNQNQNQNQNRSQNQSQNQSQNRSCQQQEDNRQKMHEDGRKILDSLFNLDNDISMILPLLLLLQKEGADEMLIMALIYIMS